MIEEELQQVFVERTLIVKQQNIAKRNYKVGNWLKLLSLHRQNKNEDACTEVIRDQIHQNFIMQQGFWLEEFNNRFKKQITAKEDIELLLLALDDGTYINVASLIAKKTLELFREDKSKKNFCLSILEKIIAFFSFDVSVKQFFNCLRDIYQQSGQIGKIRSTFERELKLAHDDFDLVWDGYNLWQSDPKMLDKNKKLFQQAKLLWDKKTVAFDSNLCSELNVKKSLFLLQSVNESKIDEERYMKWVEQLPSESQKLWFLRRVALNYKQMLEPYLLKLEILYSNDQETLIKKFKVVIRLSNNNCQIELKYLRFLGRRIGRHLLNKNLPPNYNDSWSNNVVFFREEIASLIQKQRVGVSEKEISLIFRQYYKLWIQVEERVVKDKQSVCQLYENLLKQSKDLNIYEDYANSLMTFGGLKEAKNVLKRSMENVSNEHCRSVYLSFIELYGTVEDQTEYFRKFPSNSIENQKKKENMEIQKSEVNSKGKFNAANKMENEIKSEMAPSNSHEEDKSKRKRSQKKDEAELSNSHEENTLKRNRVQMKDEVQEKIYENIRKRLHVDGDYTVFVKGIPSTWKESDVLKILQYPEKVAQVNLVCKNNQQKDYCYVQYTSKQTAEEEVKNNKSGYKLFISRPPSEYDERSTLFVCALPHSATEEKVRQLFGSHIASIVEVRLKLQKDKNYAYVEFSSVEQKQAAFEVIKKQSLLIDGKKIIVQHCDSGRTKAKKFVSVVFLKNIAFKAEENDIREFFAGKTISKISMPLTEDHRPRGFAYVEFQKFKDYQQALDMRKGKIFGREFQILRSDREITEPHSSHKKDSHNQSHASSHPSDELKEIEQKNKGTKKGGRQKAIKSPSEKDNNYFSSLFK